MKSIMWLLIVLLGSSVGITSSNPIGAPVKEETQQSTQQEQQAVADLVGKFGTKLQLVSLLAPKDVASQSMKENYGDYVSPSLLAKWQHDPQSAPGRMVSSPWPNGIKVLTVTKVSKDKYQVEGEIIEITSAEQEKGGVAAKRPIALEVRKIGDRWLIDAATLGAYEEAADVAYENTQYGFRFSLPESWMGYSIVTDKWSGLAPDDAKGEKVVETGPMISIRHPLWTSANPRQDIPVMIFTLAQWNSLQQDKFHIGAAPIGPRELARNAEYVFALPARYNFAFPIGYEEVETILENAPLKPLSKGNK